MRCYSAFPIFTSAILVLYVFSPNVLAHPASKALGAVDLAYTSNRHLTRRDPPASCANPPDLCSTCGGEDPKNKGHCVILKRAADAPAACACVPDKQVITTVIEGKTATGIYQATRLTEFASISGTTTVTKTVTQNGHETEIAIAMAGAGAGAGVIGGVAWWLASSGGDAAAAKALPESVDTDSEDDSDQPKCDDNKKPDCLDCGGADSQGNCKTGDHTGCPCKQPTCPRDDQVLKCSADNCQGKDNKCTKDPVKTCLCCPDVPLLCPDCKGSRNKCQVDESKGCQCMSEVDSSVSDRYWMIAAPSNVLADWPVDIFKNQYGGDLANIPFASYLGQPPALSDISCSGPSNQAWSPATVKDLVKQFCKGFDPNKDKKQSFSDDVTGFCASNIDIEFKKGRTGSCSKSCEDTFGDMITRCQLDSHTFNKGVNFKPPCGEFSIGGYTPDFNGIEDSICYSDASKLPQNGLAQTFDRSKVGDVIDFVCSKKLNPTIKGACSFGETKNGLMASKNDPLPFVYAHYHGEHDGCPGTGTQWSGLDDYSNQKTFKADCTKALNAAMNKCTKTGNCGQTFGGSNRFNCVDYQIFWAKAKSPPQAAKDCGAV